MMVLHHNLSTGPIVVPPRRAFRTSKTEIALLAFLVIAVVLGVLLGVGYYKVGSQTNTGTQHASTINNPVATPTLDP